MGMGPISIQNDFITPEFVTSRILRFIPLIQILKNTPPRAYPVGILDNVLLEGGTVPENIFKRSEKNLCREIPISLSHNKENEAFCSSVNVFRIAIWGHGTLLVYNSNRFCKWVHVFVGLHH